MSFSRRDFLSALAGSAPAAWLAAGGSAQMRELAAELARFTGDPDEIARDERFWSPVRILSCQPWLRCVETAATATA
jgi:hypothetical protein